MDEMATLNQLEDTQKDKFLTFELEKELYGIDIKYVTEIIGIQKITQVPELPVFVKGIINLRGKIIPVVDVRLKFAKDYKEYNDRTCIIVIEIKGNMIGLIVDTVSEVLSISEKEIEPPPKLKSIFSNENIKGIGKVGNEVKILVDCEKIFTDNEMGLLEDLN